MGASLVRALKASEREGEKESPVCQSCARSSTEITHKLTRNIVSSCQFPWPSRGGRLPSGLMSLVSECDTNHEHLVSNNLDGLFVRGKRPRAPPIREAL